MVQTVAQELEEPVGLSEQLGMALEVSVMLMPREVLLVLVPMAKESRESSILTSFHKEERVLTV